MLDPALDPRGVDVDTDGDTVVHRDCERLRAPHAAEARGQRDCAGERAAEPFRAHRGESFVGALQDALGADVDPRARGHLAVHGQTQRLEPAELLPGRPIRHQVGVGDEHPRRPLVGAQHADWTTGLHEQRLVALEVGEGTDDGLEAAPVAGRLAGAAVDHELVWLSATSGSRLFCSIRSGASVGQPAAVMPDADLDLVELDAALDRLAVSQPEVARVVNLRYFVGLTVPQAAEVMGIAADRRRLVGLCQGLAEK